MPRILPTQNKALPPKTELQKWLSSISDKALGSSGYRVTLKGPKSSTSYNIMDKKIQEFWDTCLGDDIVDEGYSLCEHIPNTTHVFSDFLFSYNAQNIDYFPSSAALRIMECFHEVLDNHYISSEPMSERFCVIQATDAWEDEEGNIKVYARFQFPFWRIPQEDLVAYIRPRVIHLLNKNSVIKDLPDGLVDGWENIMIPFNQYISMYGQPPEPHYPCFSSLEVFEDADGTEIDVTEIFNPANHEHPTVGLLPRKYWDDRDLHELFPVFLSIRFFPVILMRKDDPESAGKKTEKVETYNDVTMKDKIAMCKIFLPMLDICRYTVAWDWYVIGECLYSSCRGTSPGLDLWIQYTESLGENVINEHEHFTIDGSVRDTCRSQYYTFHDKQHTVRSLAWWASIDNPKEYKNWHMQWIAYGRHEAQSLTDFDVANMIYRHFWLEYAYDEDVNRWFNFEYGRWHQSERCLQLTHEMSASIVPPLIAELTEHLTNDPESLLEDGKSGRRKSPSASVLDLLVKFLKSYGKKATYLMECRGFFVVKDFAKNMNKQGNIIGTTNGTIELHSAGYRFRDGMPEDMLTMCCLVPYDTSFHWKHPLVLEVLNWTGMMHVDEELHEYFWKFEGSTLAAGNPEKIFPVLTGEGNNSKSMRTMIKEKVLGPYLVKLPVAILTENQRNTNSTSATPAIARCEGTREAVTEESETNIELKGGVIKRFTGNDSFYGRKLHDNGGEIKLTFKLILICNNVPIIPNADQAVKNRLLIIPFLSTWVDKNSPLLPKSKKKQYKHRIFPSDPNFCNTLSRMAPAYLWLMCQAYVRYKKNGLVPPQIVVEYTNRYWKSNDFYASYIADCVEIILDDEGSADHDFSVDVGVMYQNFRIWYRSSGASGVTPDRNTFINEMSSKWGRPISSKWTGIRMKEQDNGNAAANDNDYSKPSLPKFFSSSQKMTKPKESRL